MKIVDLSVVINTDTPVYPGDPTVEIAQVGVFEKDGYNDHKISLATHVGTHIDAPFHMIADGKTLDQFPPEQFIGRGKYIKIESSRYDLDAIKAAGIQEGDVVLFHTGMSDRYREESYYTDFPEVPEEVAEYLVEQKVKMVGMDMGTPDNPTFAVHKILLGGGVLIAENLTNLEQLEEKEFTVYALPIKLQLDGAPARVIAVINS